MMRPQWRARILGSTRSVIAMTERTIAWKCFDHRAGSGRRRGGRRAAGVVHEDVDGAELAFDVGDLGIDLGVGR